IEGWPDAFRNMMQAFYQAVEQGNPQAGGFATFHEGAQVMAIVEAIVHSHQQQCWVSVEI
ncbi:Gfo/Idh/MocA family oxidoreductase, partial [Erwinia sp.]|uniref:Gfo/Idh/MocA family oxidoreductase n=1 Tax=Erwinia citreus TaxID=558 RepID=UPI003C707FB3